MNIGNLKLGRDMKYTALYSALGYFETEDGVYSKRYPGGLDAIIYSDGQVATFGESISFSLDTHESFVKLEFIDRLLSIGYSPDSFVLEDNGARFKGFDVVFYAWDVEFDEEDTADGSVLYKSRLVSGIIEYLSRIRRGGEWYDYGLFEEYGQCELTKKKTGLFTDDDFVFDEDKVVKYVGTKRKVVVPEGVVGIKSTAFWDNLFIEEVVLPDSLKNIGGDTFYNCRNLLSVNIPKGVVTIGDNPFAGCLRIKIRNESPHFVYEDGVLFSEDKKTLIYCSIDGTETEYVVPDGVAKIGKHAFYSCDRFTKIVLPKSLKKMVNNPFSGCSKLALDNHSDAYHVENDVIYNRYKTSVIGVLNKIEAERLELLEGVKAICRNSFWNCKGIGVIVLPESLEDIGYNPFVECTSIRFESKSPNFKVVDDVLYNADCSKVICYPAWKAVGEVRLPDSVISLERGAFSGCRKMEKINLHNVSAIRKSCFTNCESLKSVYCSDFVQYIGEWAFAYCKSLFSVSVSRDTVIDNNAFSNCPATLERRKKLSDYVFESENLFTLKSMQNYYAGKIDAVLIDPPYNSKIDYIGYKDGGFEDYIAYIKERMNLSYKLLSDAGFFIINIDQGEFEDIFDLCKSIFGDDLVTVHRWKKRNAYFDANRVVRNKNKVDTDFEYMLVCRKSKRSHLKKIMQPYIEDSDLKEREADFPETFDFFGTTSSAKDEMADIFGDRDFFSTPKPLKLVKELLRATTDRDSMILDYFAGSGTVGHACLDLNADDGGNRKFILVNNSESNICKEVTYKRFVRLKGKYGEDVVMMA